MSLPAASVGQACLWMEVPGMNSFPVLRVAGEAFGPFEDNAVKE